MTISRRALLFSFATSMVSRSSNAHSATVSRRATAFGTIVSITATGATHDQVIEALDASFTSIRAVEASMNLFDADSEISQLNRTGKLINPSTHFQAVLAVARRVHQQTGGAFDPTIQPLWNMWQTSLKAGHPPSQAQVQQALTTTGFHNFSTRDTRGRQLTFNGIAQGYACDLVATSLKLYGITEATFDTGEPGRIGPAHQASLIGIRHPRQPNELIGTINTNGGFLAVSGDYETTFTPDFTDHHIFDPATGRSPTELSSVVVFARTGALADAYATAMMVMGSAHSLNLASAVPGLEVLLVDKQSRLFMSAGMLNRFSATS